jgi:hypothetical protein
MCALGLCPGVNIGCDQRVVDKFTMLHKPSLEVIFLLGAGTISWVLRWGTVVA